MSGMGEPWQLQFAINALRVATAGKLVGAHFHSSLGMWVVCVDGTSTEKTMSREVEHIAQNAR